MQAIQSHSGHTSIGSLGERDQAVRDMFENQRKQAILDEQPIAYEAMPEGTRIFRLPEKTGFKYVYEMKKKISNALGDTMQEASHDFIKFEPHYTGFFGELILRPDDPKLKNGKFEEKVEQAEFLMLDPEYAWLGVIDWMEARDAHESNEAEQQAARMASDHNWMNKVLARVRKMGVSLTDGFGEDQA